jgi:hypothetical protein
MGAAGTGRDQAREAAGMSGGNAGSCTTTNRAQYHVSGEWAAFRFEPARACVSPESRLSFCLDFAPPPPWPPGKPTWRPWSGRGGLAFGGATAPVPVAGWAPRPFDDAKAARLHLCGAGAEGSWPATPPGLCFPGREMWSCLGVSVGESWSDLRWRLHWKREHDCVDGLKYWLLDDCM